MSVGPIDPFQNVFSVPSLYLADGGVSKVSMAGDVVWSNPLDGSITQVVINADGQLLAAPSQLQSFSTSGTSYFVLSPDGEQIGNGSIPNTGPEENLILAVTWNDDGVCVAWQDENADTDESVKITTPLGTAVVGNNGYSQIGAVGSVVYLGGATPGGFGSDVVVAASDGQSISFIDYPISTSDPVGCVGSPHGVYVGGGDSAGHISNLSWAVSVGFYVQYVAASETAAYGVVIVSGGRELVKVSPEGDIEWTRSIGGAGIGALSAAGGVVYAESGGVIKRFLEDGTALSDVPASAGWIAAVPQITGSN